MQTLSCRSCGAELDAQQLDRRLAIITCSHCDAIFDLTRRGAGGISADAPADAEPLDAEPTREPEDTLDRAPVAMPSRFIVEHGPERFSVRWRWFQISDVFLLFFAIFWNSILLVVYAAMASSNLPGPMLLMLLLLPLGHLLVGIVVAYRAIAGLLNRTELAVEGQTLRVRHYPLPWWPAPTIPVDSLEQLYACKSVKRGKKTTSTTYEVRAVTRDHKGQLLLRGLPSLDQALWIEQEIELHLYIRDRPVAGEIKGDDTEL